MSETQTTAAPSRLLVAAIAAVAHDANRRWCMANGDFSQQEWEVAPDWQRESAMAGVEGILTGRITGPEQSHAGWMAHKQADGWVYGERKDPTEKTHPCMVPYDQLPPAQRVKDALFFGIVRALGHLDG